MGLHRSFELGPIKPKRHRDPLALPHRSVDAAARHPTPEALVFCPECWHSSVVPGRRVSGRADGHRAGNVPSLTCFLPCKTNACAAPTDSDFRKLLPTIQPRSFIPVASLDCIPGNVPRSRITHCDCTDTEPVAP